MSRNILLVVCLLPFVSIVIYACSCFNIRFINISAIRNSLNKCQKNLHYLCHSKTYFQSGIQLNLNSLIFKNFFEWVNFFVYVEKQSFIATYNRIVLLYISADSVPQVLAYCAYISVTVFVIPHILLISHTQNGY